MSRRILQESSQQRSYDEELPAYQTAEEAEESRRFGELVAKYDNLRKDLIEAAHIAVELHRQLEEATPTQPMVPAYSLLGGVFLLLAATLQILLVMSGGGGSSSPSDGTYFLQSSTHGIPGARNPARWTYMSMCSVSDRGRNVDCGRTTLALPFSPAHSSNFGTRQGVPEALLRASGLLHLSKLAWVMYLFALMTTLGALGYVVVSNFLVQILESLDKVMMTSVSLYVCIAALGLQTFAACVMSAWTHIARRELAAAGQEAWLGRNAYGFTWGSVTFLAVAVAASVMDLMAVKKRFSADKATKAAPQAASRAPAPAA